MTQKDDLQEILKKEPKFQTARELANILLRGMAERESKIEHILKVTNTKWYECPKHGKRVGFFYICDECSRLMEVER